VGDTQKHSGRWAAVLSDFSAAGRAFAAYLAASPVFGVVIASDEQRK